MCLDIGDMDRLQNDLLALVAELGHVSSEYIHGYLCSYRVALGRFDDALSDGMEQGQLDLHSEIYHLYTNTLNNFHLIERDGLNSIVTRLSDLVSMLEPLEDEDDHECDDEDGDCYYDQYLNQRHRAMQANERIQRLEAQLKEHGIEPVQ